MNHDHPSLEMGHTVIELGKGACVFACGLAKDNEDHVISEADEKQLAIELGRLAKSVRGNRSREGLLTWDDLRLIFAAQLRKAIELLEGERE